MLDKATLIGVTHIRSGGVMIVMFAYLDVYVFNLLFNTSQVGGRLCWGMKDEEPNKTDAKILYFFL